MVPADGGSKQNSLEGEISSPSEDLLESTSFVYSSKERIRIEVAYFNFQHYRESSDYIEQTS